MMNLPVNICQKHQNFVEYQVFSITSPLFIYKLKIVPVYFAESPRVIKSSDVARTFRLIRKFQICLLIPDPSDNKIKSSIVPRGQPEEVYAFVSA